LVGDKNSFLLTVKGDSMIEAGIFDGDIVIVREGSSARNGDIVVAMLEDGATVKTFYQERDCVRLQPQNPALEPIFTRDAVILGTVTGLFRSL
ncbi:MAG: transcriptional repressor LexA, partial [Coriobacteriales bacterium]|nr:transcriptional repressor LexA [Coriobacteriales bacterium]